MRAQKLMCSMLLMISASGAMAERVNCWDSHTSQIVAHNAGETIGNFELSGVSSGDDSDAGALAYKCSGTFLLSAGLKQYSYLCELYDEAGDKFSLQNSDTKLGEVQFIAGGGTGKYTERAGSATEFRNFPVNHDGSLRSCDPNLTAFRLP